MAAPGPENENDDFIMVVAPVSKRERKVTSVMEDPMSPSSSSTSKDDTDIPFEPTIEMMVNDFDDEQTLNEEEALSIEEGAEEEIDTLKQESEMPLEELLAKYTLPPIDFAAEPPRKKTKKSSGKKKHKSRQRLSSPALDEEKQTETYDTANKGKYDTDIPESSEEKEMIADDDDDVEEDITKKVENVDLVKVRRSHLLELYPEGTFGNVVSGGKDIPLETLYAIDGEEEEEEGVEEDDEEYKKKVMIGSSYQAFIPKGLSQYGDILPYENEDKLIWEPSQVAEREVEAYLLKIRDINRNQGSEVEITNSFESINCLANKEVADTSGNYDDIENNSLMANGEKKGQHTTITEEQAVVKDNEQALHLLVQCGYDFKEALRRKSLNALPMNDCMSLWSEEECQNFEEGIQKYGKDFLKIRQHQVRTRTMRELVQFYYLWKKTERRDHNFANTDTVDHMDIYLNEDEYGSNPTSVGTPQGSPVNTSYSAATRRNSQKNISIMAANASTVVITNSSSATLDKTSTSQHKKRSTSSNSAGIDSVNCENTPASVITSTVGVSK